MESKNDPHRRLRSAMWSSDTLVKGTRFTRSGWEVGPHGGHGAKANLHGLMDNKSFETSPRHPNL